MRSHLIIPSIMAVAVFSFPLMFPESYWITVLIYVGIYGLIVIGYDLLLGYCGQVSLGHNGLFAIGAYGTGITTVWFGWPPFAGILTSIFVTGIVAFLLGLPALRLKGYYLAIATMGFAFIIGSILQTTYFGGSSGISNIPPFRAFGFAFTTYRSYYYLIWGVVFLVVLICIGIGETGIGRAMKAVHSDEEAAGSMGINVARVKIQAFVFSAVLAALAGSLYAHFSTIIAPTSFSIMVTVKLLLMLFLGGVGTVYGGLFGAFILLALPEFLGHLDRWELALEGLIFILILIFLPGGIVGGFTKMLRLYRIKMLAYIRQKQ